MDSTTIDVPDDDADAAGPSPRDGFVNQFRAALTDRALPGDPVALIDEIQDLEAAGNALAARRARVTAAFVASQQADQISRRFRKDRAGRGIAAQVGLARQLSPHQAQRYVRQVMTLTTELPASFARLQAGEVSEWRVLKVAEHTGWLSAEHRAAVDAEIAPQLGGLGTRAITDLTNQIGYRLDPRGATAQLKKAHAERHVSINPAPHDMSTLATLASITQVAAAWTSLSTHADSLLKTPEETRTRSQIMADTLIERVTGHATATAVPVQLNLVMTDHTLFGGPDDPDADEPAHLVGSGPIPAPVARQLICDADDVFIRRLFTRPDTGELVAMESRSRGFPKKQRQFLEIRDQICRTPYCDAPIRHADHVTPHADGGKTCVHGAQGKCEDCNYIKESAGWKQHVEPDGTIITTTPTGHQYRSQPRRPPGRSATAA